MKQMKTLNNLDVLVAFLFNKLPGETEKPFFLSNLNLKAADVRSSLAR
jgi:hypothetical protein